MNRQGQAERNDARKIIIKILSMTGLVVDPKSIEFNVATGEEHNLEIYIPKKLNPKITEEHIVALSGSIRNDDILVAYSHFSKNINAFVVKAVTDKKYDTNPLKAVANIDLHTASLAFIKELQKGITNEIS